MRITTVCPKCDKAHPTNGHSCRGKVNAYLKKYRHKKGISQSFRKKGRTSPFIKNGKEYSPEWHIIRLKVYRRDRWVCQECGCKCVDGRDKRSNEYLIQCHHIDYDTKNNKDNNLITLCVRCHAKTNYNRQEWIIYYKGIMTNKISGVNLMKYFQLPLFKEMPEVELKTENK